MKNLLLGNGINIQFGGIAYSSQFIVKRMKYYALTKKYSPIFSHKVSSDDLIKLFDNFIDVANDINKGCYDLFAENRTEKEIIREFQKRYKGFIFERMEDIMIEDWLTVLHIFLMKSKELEKVKVDLFQGFERLLLYAIYNGGKIQNIYLNMNQQVKKFLLAFDSIYTVNYDNNIENLTGKEVYHLHGDFSILRDSENPECVLGYLREKNKEQVLIDGYECCFCNALLNYTGKEKLNIANSNYKAIKHLTHFIENNSEINFQALKSISPLSFEYVITKKENPSLKIATDYHFEEFKRIYGAIYIIGLSPNNDEHLFNLIANNKSIEKIYFYYYNLEEKNRAIKLFPAKKLICCDVIKLWESLGCKSIINIDSPYLKWCTDKTVTFINTLSKDHISLNELKNSFLELSQTKIDSLCVEVKEYLSKANQNNFQNDINEQIDEISCIALQNGIHPAVLHLICSINIEKIREH